ncbi:MAG: hypothetical protein H0W76_18725 [Pyrinomonadaceae bacterium]|nr:hypothetical protein [Pyrinomonadaceae bacterium]
MRNTKRLAACALLPVLLCGGLLVGVDATAAQRRPPTKRTPTSTTTAAEGNQSGNRNAGERDSATGATANDASAQAGESAAGGGRDGELAAILALPTAERVTRLEAFVKENPTSPVLTRATHLLTSARAALGDELLRAGDAAGGTEQFRRAVADAPSEMPEKLFIEVISQLPSNLFLRGEGAAALDLARRIEEKSKADAKRLLVVAAFYLSVDQGDDAARAAALAVKLAPELAAAHQALGLAHRIALELDPAAEAFKRALELDPRLASARRNLADLYRAAGKSEQALLLYREQVVADPKDTGARGGMVLALLDSGRKEEAEKEVRAALAAAAPNLTLLAGAAYWYAAHDDAARAIELAERAVRIEPRYTWTQIAYARALVADKRPLEAERALRFARQYGRFPTLDYELANALAAAGLYQEAAEELARTFAIKDGQIETQLAGRVAARAADFIELLAPERRASIFQATPADTEENARLLKGLLMFHLATGAADAKGERAAEDFLVAGGSGSRGSADAMRAFRQLYVAERLLRHGAALTKVLEASEAAMGGVEAALDVPVASVAVLADSLRDIRARDIAAGTTPELPAVPRNILSNILRGRIEDVAGQALFRQGQAAEAAVRLRRAISVLPEATLWWRDAMWHLGLALEANGNQAEALAVLMRGYDRRAPSPARRVVIETLYRRVNGSLSGFDAKLGAATPLATTTPAAAASTPSALSSAATPEPSLQNDPPRRIEADQVEEKSVNTGGQIGAERAVVTEAAKGDATETAERGTPETLQTSAPAAATTSSVAPPVNAPEATPESSTVASTPAAAIPSSAVSETNAAPSASKRRRGARAEKCSISINQTALEINHGGSTSLTVSFDAPVSADRVRAATTNWSDIIVLAEPPSSTDANTLKFTISSISRAVGTFIITFTSPCGKQEVAVTVK